MAEWTQEATDICLRLRHEGFACAYIGKILGKSRSSVQSWLSRRDKPTFGGGCDRWTEEEEAELRQMIDAGVRVKAIAVKLDRTVRAITGKKRRLDLAKSRSDKAAMAKLEDGNIGHVRLLYQYYAKRSGREERAA
jgi:hypothetical protein